MTWHVHEDGLWGLTCDQCGDGWYGWDGDVRFEFRQDLQAFARLSRWLIGSAAAICPTCAWANECGKTGHEWGPWTSVGPSTLVPESRTTRVRICRSCTSVEYDPPQ